MTTQIIGGFLFAFLGTATLIFFTFGPRGVRRPLAVDGVKVGQFQRMLSAFSDFLTLLDSKVAEFKWLRRISRYLSYSGLKISIGRYLAIAVISCVMLFSTGLVVNGTIAGLTLGVASVAGFAIFPRVLTHRRMSKFEDQFDFTLELFSSSIRAGHGLLRAIEVVAKESESPTSQEFGRALNEHRIGVDVTTSLLGIAGRMKSQEMEWVVQAIGVHLEAGGNLSSMFDDVLLTIRDRNLIRQQVKALSADGRISARVMSAIPVALMVGIGVLNPNYFEPILNDEIAPLFIGALVAFFGAGVLWVSKITKISF